MALFLAQHGISGSREIDPQRGLTAEGIIETERIANVAQGYGVRVEKIVHSGKRRAEQTASIFHQTLSVSSPLEAVDGIDPLDSVQSFARTIMPDSSLMVVGHMPFMQRLVSFLTTGDEDIMVYQFQNSGLVCLDTVTGKDGRADWFIRWTLNPNIS